MVSKPRPAATSAARCRDACRLAACGIRSMPWRRSADATAWCDRPASAAIAADRPVPGDVPVAQVTGHVGEAEPAQRRPPAGVRPAASGRRTAAAAAGSISREVPGQPVLVQPGLSADRGQAGARRPPAPGPAPGCRGSRPGGPRSRPPRPAACAPAACSPGRWRRARPRPAPAAPSGGVARGSRAPWPPRPRRGPGRPAGRVPVPAALPSRTAASKTRRAVNAAARSLRVCGPSRDWPRSRPNASQYASLVQPCALRCAVTERSEPAAQVAGHQRSVDDHHLADRRVAGRAVRQHGDHGATGRRSVRDRAGPGSAAALITSADIPALLRRG